MTSRVYATIACSAIGLIFLTIFGHVLLRMPIAFGDQFEEIVLVYTQPLGDTLDAYMRIDAAFFRPLEYVWRYAIAALGQGVWGYAVFQIFLLGATTFTFILVCRPENLRDVISFGLALAVLFGHHSFQGTWELNITFSNGLVVLFVTLAMFFVSRRGNFLIQVFILTIVGLSLLTKEIGLVVPGLFVLAYILGFAGIRRSTAFITVMMTAAYLGYRLLSGSADDAAEVGKASEIIGYISNIAAAFIMFWVGLPNDGNWARAADDATEIWRWFQILAGISSVALILAAYMLGSKKRTLISPTSLYFDRRWLTLFGAVLAACCVLAFYYARHRHGAPAVPLLAYVCYLSVQIILSNVKNDPVLTRGISRFAILALVLFAAIWPLRLVSGFEFARGLNAGIHAAWREDMAIYWSRYEERDREFLRDFAESVDAIPVARTSAPILSRFGNRNSVNR